MGVINWAKSKVKPKQIDVVNLGGGGESSCLLSWLQEAGNTRQERKSYVPDKDLSPI